MLANAEAIIEAIAEVAPPPCEGCRHNAFCTKLEMLCLAFRHYASANPEKPWLFSERIPDWTMRRYREKEYKSELKAQGKRRDKAKAAK